MDETLAQQLGELDRERLLELIVSIHGYDAAIDRQIAAFAARRVPSRHEAEIRSWIRDLTPSRRGSSRFEAIPVAHDVDRIVGELSALIGHGDPDVAFGLIEQVLGLGPRLIEAVDDSDVFIQISLQELGPLWMKAARHCRDAGRERDWLAAIEALLEKDDYCLLEKLLPSAAELLSGEELRRLADRYETRAANEADPHRRCEWLNRAGELAWPLADPALFVRTQRLVDPELSADRREAIAKCFLEMGDPQGALEWLATPWPGSEWKKSSLLAEAYGALGRRADQIAVMREEWERSPSVLRLESWLALLSPDEAEKAKEEAGAKAPGLRDLDEALELLVFLGRSREAGELCVKRCAELAGQGYYRFKDLAQAFVASEPLAASLIFRSLLDEILKEKKSRAYHHAAEYFGALGRLAGSIEDWRGHPDHRSYIVSLRYEHGRKTAFWYKVGG